MTGAISSRQQPTRDGRRSSKACKRASFPHLDADFAHYRGALPGAHRPFSRGAIRRGERGR